MKRSLSFLIVTLLILMSNNLNACTCIYSIPYFCQTFNETMDVYLVVVTDTLNRHDIEVTIIDSIQHSTTEKTLKILGQDGLNCGESMRKFNLNDSLVFALNNFKISSGNYEYSWYLNGCGRSYLHYSNNEVHGEIDATLTSQNYQTFKDNIVSCFSMEVSSYDIENKAAQLIVYPNPASDYLYIDLNLNGIQDAQLDILNSKGQILRSHLNFKPGKQQLKIDDLPNNQLSFLRVKTNMDMTMYKFFIL